MLSKILNSRVIYVQVWEHRIRVLDTETGSIFDEKPFVLIKQNAKGIKTIEAIGNNAEYVTSSNEESINPFSHPRFLLSNFFVAEKLLQHIIRKFMSGNFLAPSPIIVIHPMEKIDGGLSGIEDRAFRELGLGAGARDVFIYTGETLPIEKLNIDNLKELDDGVDPTAVTGKSYKSILVYAAIILIYFYYLYLTL